MEFNPTFDFDMTLPIQENTIFSGKSYNEFTKRYSQNVIEICSKLSTFSSIAVPANTKLTIINSNFKPVEIEFDSEIEIYSLLCNQGLDCEIQVIISPFEMLGYISIINKLEKINDPDKLKCVTLLNSWNYILIDMIIDKNFNFQLKINNSSFDYYYQFNEEFKNISNNIRDLVSSINLGRINNKHWRDENLEYHIFDSSLYGRCKGINLMEYDTSHILENRVNRNNELLNCKNIISPTFECGNEYLISEILNEFKLVTISDKSILSYKGQEMNLEKLQSIKCSKIHDMYRIIGEDINYQQFIQLFKDYYMKELLTNVSVKKYSDNISVETLSNSIWTENKLILNNCSISKDIVETYQEFTTMLLDYTNNDVELAKELNAQFPLRFIALSVLYRLCYAILKGELKKELETYKHSGIFKYLCIFCQNYLDATSDSMLLPLKIMIQDISRTIRAELFDTKSLNYSNYYEALVRSENNLDRLSHSCAEYFKMNNWNENFINKTFDSLVKIDISFHDYSLSIDNDEVITLFYDPFNLLDR